MEPHDDTPTQDKQITIAVPEDRVPEFYAFYARFLAAGESGRRRHRGHRGRGRGGHGHCGHHRADEVTDAPATEAQAPTPQPAG